jgi:hypothetical protein
MFLSFYFVQYYIAFCYQLLDLAIYEGKSALFAVASIGVLARVTAETAPIVKPVKDALTLRAEALTHNTSSVAANALSINRSAPIAPSLSTYSMSSRMSRNV